MPTVRRCLALSGAQNTNEIFQGTKHSEETKQLMSEKAKSLLDNPNHTSNKTRGIARTEDVKNKIRESKKKYDYLITCPHCGKEGKVAGMKSWHFDNCRNKNDNV